MRCRTVSVRWYVGCSAWQQDRSGSWVEERGGEEASKSRASGRESRGGPGRHQKLIHPSLARGDLAALMSEPMRICLVSRGRDTTTSVH